MCRTLTLALALVAISATPLAAQPRSVVIDAGHGDQDPGGTGNGLQEKNIVLDVALRFAAALNADTADTSGGGEWEVSLTRSDDTFVPLAGRSAFANGKNADRFISIHANAFGNAAANGTETFSFSGGGTGAALRDEIQREMIKSWGLTNRGSKTASFAVLRDTAMPAALHELAFVTNATDAAKLNSEQERQKAAEAHMFALQRHFGLDPFVPGTAPDDAGSVSGRVTSSGQPVEGALVTIDDSVSVETGADGTFAVTELAAGSYRLQVDASGFLPSVSDVEVTAGQVAELVIELRRNDDGPDEPDDEEPGDDVEGGCQASQGGSGPFALLLLLALFGAAARRRRLR